MNNKSPKSSKVSQFTLHQSLYRRFCDYNLFIPNEHDYDEKAKDPVFALKQQKYTTRLYVLLLAVSMYVLFYSAMIKPQARTVIITDIDRTKFELLYSEHGERLSCLCSTIISLYRNFVSNTIKFHPVCSSFFVSQQWIESLYLFDRSKYGVADFRTIATSQFQLLSSLCSLAQDITEKNELDLDNKEFITIYLLPESKIQLEVNATVQFFKNTLSNRILSFVNYFRFVTRANCYISSLNTNGLISLILEYRGMFLQGEFEIYDPNVYNEKSSLGISCRSDNPTSSTAFFEPFFNTSSYNGETWRTHPLNSTLIKGFFAGCTSFEGFLKSTLDCLYEIKCLQLFSNYFPSINQTNLNLTNYVLYSEKSNITLYDHLSNLFIDEWIITLNYTKYFHNCNALVCTYSTTDIINYSYTITLFISLYGGLILILRSISPFLINILFKLKYQNIHTNNRFVLCKNFSQWMKQFNLFKNINKRTEENVKQQIINSYIYLILLTISITVLLVFNSLNTETIVTSISKPSLNTYNNLQKLYPNELNCPCSTITIPQYGFISLSPTLHQICSSDFITDNWMSILKQITVLNANLDWRNRAYQQYSMLSTLCQLSNETITNAIHEFLTQTMIVSNLLTENDFNIQLNKSLLLFYQSTIAYFRHFIQVVDLHIQVDQPFMATSLSFFFEIDLFSVRTIITNTTNHQQITEVILYPIYNLDIYSKMIKCFCSTNPNCQRPSVILDIDITEEFSTFRNPNISYVLEGSFIGCSNINSLLLSNFECLYSDSICFFILMNYIKQTYIWYAEYPPWFDAKPLVYNSTLTRFNRTTPISMIIEEIMIEQWNPSYSYENFYHLCSPIYCTYPHIVHTKDMIGVLLTLISLISGLTLSLRLITNHLVQMIFIIISKIFKKQKEEEEEDNCQSILEKNQNLFNRLKSIKQKLTTSLYNILIDFNIFSPHTFGSNVDQLTAKRLGQQTTRLYFFLLIICFLILTLYTIIQQHILTKTFNQPSFNTYNQLIQNNHQDLKCFCSSIATTYNQFVEIKPVFHQICTSSFITNEIIDNLRISLSSNISVYDERDYRRIISSHIQYLKGLCEISIDLINSSIEQFLSTLFITKELLLENIFNQNLNSSIEQIKLNTPNLLNSMFSLLRNVNHGNSIISSYGTNFKYIIRSNYTFSSRLQSEAIIYDNECSCGLYSNCTTQAYIIENNLSKQILIKGLKIGCIPSESFLFSTLECFYDNTCIDIIKQYILNSEYSLQPLSIPFDQSRINMTINQLIKNLFVDQWLTSINYLSYFKKCSPVSCSYNYIEKFNIIYIISFLLGLQGGLMIVLKWICPKLTQVILKINQYRKKSTNNVVPIEYPLNNIRVTTNIFSENIPTTSTNQLLITPLNSFKIFCFYILLLILIVSLVLFSIYTAREKYNQTIQSIFSTVTATSAYLNIITTPNSSVNIVSYCSLTFESIAIFQPGTKNPSVPITGDFNNDNQLDIGFINLSTDPSLFVLLGNGDGTFGEPIILPLENFGSDLRMVVADFNQDQLFDIVLADGYSGSVTILLGNGDGSFSEGIMLFPDDCNYPSGISTADFNNDSYIDIAVACDGYSNVSVYFGDIDGLFLEKIILYTGKDTASFSIDVTDFNNDSYIDIIIVNYAHRVVGVFLGHGNGSFDTQKTSYTGGGVMPGYIAIGDFNEDTKQDIVLSYIYGSANGVIFGYGNGSFGEKIRLVVKSGSIYMAPTVSDFNRDGHLDIATITMTPYAVDIFYGDGNGHFETCRIFSTEFYGSFSSITTGDFNNDNYPDIITTYENPGGLHILLNQGQYNTSQDVQTSTN